MQRSPASAIVPMSSSPSGVIVGAEDGFDGLGGGFVRCRGNRDSGDSRLKKDGNVGLKKSLVLLQSRTVVV